MKPNIKEAKNKNYQIWGWVSAIVGGLFAVWSIFWALAAIYSYLRLDPLYYDYIFMKDLIITVGAIRSITGLIIGIPLLILGIRLIRKGEIPSTNFSGLDQFQADGRE